MGIANRDKDASEKQYCVHKQLQATATAATVPLMLVSHPCKVKSARFAGTGLSGLPSYQLQIRRTTSGGATVIALGPAVALAGEHGVTAAAQFSSSLLALDTEDMIEVVSAVANTATDDLCIGIVLESLQDIKEEYGATS